MPDLKPKMQNLIYYYDEHRISVFFRKSLGWMIAYLFFLFIFFIYPFTYSLFPKSDSMMTYFVTSLLIILIICYSRLMYLLEKALGNLENISFKEKITRCGAAVFNTRGMLRITELPSVKEEQMKKLKEEFLDKENINSKEKVYALIEELERKFEYESKHNFFIPLNFSWFLALFIPIWTVSIKLFTKVYGSDFQSFTFANITYMIIILMIVCSAFYIMASFFKTTLYNVVMFHFPSTKNKIEFLISLLQEIYLWYCFEEDESKEDDN